MAKATLTALKVKIPHKFKGKAYPNTSLASFVITVTNIVTINITRIE